MELGADEEAIIASQGVEWADRSAGIEKSVCSATIEEWQQRDLYLHWVSALEQFLIFMLTTFTVCEGSDSCVSCGRPSETSGTRGK